MQRSEEGDGVLPGSGVRAGLVTTIVLVAGLAFAVLTAVGDRTTDGVVTGCCAFVLCVGLSLCPMGAMARSMRVPLGFASVVFLIAVAVGAFSLSLPLPVGQDYRAALPALLGTRTLDDAAVSRWGAIATIAIIAAVVVFLVSLVLLMRLRRHPQWEPARWGPIGFFAEGLRRSWQPPRYGEVKRAPGAESDAEGDRDR